MREEHLHHRAHHSRAVGASHSCRHVHADCSSSAHGLLHQSLLDGSPCSEDALHPFAANSQTANAPGTVSLLALSATCCDPLQVIHGTCKRALCTVAPAAKHQASLGPDAHQQWYVSQKPIKGTTNQISAPTNVLPCRAL